MCALTRNQPEGSVPLSNAVFCLDCEYISSSRGDECIACNSRSLMSLARMLGGSLLAHKAQQLQGESVAFDVSITVELKHVHARDLSTTVERLTSVVGPRLSREEAALHVSVKPTARSGQQSFYFLERDAA
jgi:hypothetical protein